MLIGLAPSAIFSGRPSANLLYILSLLAKELWISANIWRR